MRIIMVGPDGAGKTTFGKEFAKEYNLEYIPCTNKEDNKFVRAVNLLLEKDNVLFDRFYLPDHLVYSILKEDKLSPEEIGAWTGLITDLREFGDVLVFYIDAPDNILKERLEKRGDDYVTFEEIKDIRAIYKKVLPELDVPIIRLESTNDGIKLKGFGM